MLKRLSAREILLNLAVEWEATLAREWLAAIRAITSAVVLKELVAEIERSNLDGAMRLLNIDADRFARFEASILAAYNQGGQGVVGSMPSLRDPSGNKVSLSWGVRNTPGEQNLRQHAASLVDGVVGEQLGLMRETLANGLARGQNPRQTALRLVGPINKRSGLREGGILGQTPSTVERLDRLFLGLRSGDEEQMLRYLGIARRDLDLPPAELAKKLKQGGYARNYQFDGHVVRALRTGAAVPAEATDRIVKAYSNKALEYRADQIALHETRIALSSAQRDAFQQQVDAGRLEASDLTKTWRRSISKNKRPDHITMVGTTIPFGEKFTLPSGVQCDGPHDPSLPARESLGCTCAMDVSVDFTAQALRRYRERVGG